MHAVIKDASNWIIDEVGLIKNDYFQIGSQRYLRVSDKCKRYIILELYTLLRKICQLHIPKQAAFKEFDIGFIADLKDAVHLGKSFVCTSHGISQMDKDHRDFVYFVDKGITNAHHGSINRFSIFK